MKQEQDVAPERELIDNAAWPYNSLMVSREHRVMFMPIAKNANTSLKRLFVSLSGHPDSDRMLAGNIHSYLTSHNTGLRLCDYSFAEAQALMNDERYFRFVVLRNPIARATSGYLSKFVRDRQFEEKKTRRDEVIGPAIDWVYAKRNEPPDYQRSITFEEFVDHVVSNDDDHVDTHFRSQSSYLGGMEFDHVAVQENLAPLITELEARFSQPVTLEHKNNTPRSRDFIRGWGASRQLPFELRANRRLVRDSRLLTANLKRKLEQRFAQDIELWEQAANNSR